MRRHLGGVDFFLSDQPGTSFYSPPWEGGDAVDVSKLMSHANVKMTVDQYYHLLGDKKRRTIAKLPSLSKSKEVEISPSV